VSLPCTSRKINRSRRYRGFVEAQEFSVPLIREPLIQPEEVVDQSFGRRRKQEEAAHPAFVHLDRLR